jgi:hypothetical protein
MQHIDEAESLKATTRAKAPEALDDRTVNRNEEIGAFRAVPRCTEPVYKLESPTELMSNQLPRVSNYKRN